MERLSERQVDEHHKILGNTAPRITSEHIDSVIRKTTYWNPPGATLTVCVLTLKNGFCVVGESASASPENFDAELGKRLAYDNARNKIWQLEGYLLRSQLAG